MPETLVRRVATRRSKTAGPQPVRPSAHVPRVHAEPCRPAVWRVDARDDARQVEALLASGRAVQAVEQPEPLPTDHAAIVDDPVVAEFDLTEVRRAIDDAPERLEHPASGDVPNLAIGETGQQA